jgi:DNA-binding NarL/FixJ family response regulator
VKAHLSRVQTRLGCANQVQPAIVAHEAGLLASPWQ